MPSSCKEIRAALAECLQESECVMVQRHTAAECLRSPLAETLPTKCQQLKKGFGDCRRGMIDMRLRFRGNQPVTFKSLEDSEGGKGYQLYAGKAAFAGSMKETGGDEKEAPDWRDIENQRYRQQQQQQQQQQGQRQEQGKQGKPSQQQEQPPPPPPPPTSPQQQQESSGQSGQTKQNEQSKKSWSLWS